MKKAGSRHINLEGGNADVWTWRKRVAGTCSCEGGAERGPSEATGAPIVQYTWRPVIP